MVKAIKRKTGEEVGGQVKEKKAPFVEKYGKIVFLGILALIVIGFTLNVPNLSGSGSQEPPAEQLEPDYGVGFPLGTQDGIIGELSGNRGVYGQLSVATNLKDRLGGDLYLFDEGYSQLIVTNASVEEIEDKATGSFVIYEIANCGNFDCFVGNNTNVTSYEVYELDLPSQYIEGSKIGFPL